MENRVNKVHARALRLVYDDSRNLLFEGLQVKSNRVNIHQKISKLLLRKSLKQNGVYLYLCFPAPGPGPGPQPRFWLPA